MIRSIGFGVLALALVAGCSGSDGSNGKDGANGENGTPGENGSFDGTASVSGVFPGSAFLGGTVEVTLSGFATEWDESTTISFGDGVTVSNVRVASPTALIATVEVASTAAMGLRDVSISTGDSALTYAQGFNVASPIAIDVQGDVAQGSIFLATIRNLNPQLPFDDTSTGDGLFTPIEFTNVSVSAPAGVIVQVNDVTTTSISVAVLIDGDATAGATPLEVLSGPTGAEISFPNPMALDVAARTPTALTANADTDFTVAEAFGSEYVSIAIPSGLHIVDLSATSGTGSPALAMLGASQSFQDLLSVSPTFVGAADGGTWYGVLWDNSGEIAVDATVNYAAIAATSFAEGASNGDKGSATAITAPAVVQAARLTDDLDADWFAVTVAAGDVGKRFSVATYAGSPATDTLITIYDPTDSEFAVSGDEGYHDNLLSDPITAAGTYYVVISASDFGLTADRDYDAAIYLK